MRFKTILVGMMFSLLVLSPQATFASQEKNEEEKSILVESQNKNNNLNNISNSVLTNISNSLEDKKSNKKQVKAYLTNITTGELVYGKEMDILVTGYSSTPDQCWGDPFITASGARVHQGTMACPPEYSFGTEIEIEGMGTFICEDRGGKIKGNHFDMWFASRGEALNWGKRTVTARIIQ